MAYPRSFTQLFIILIYIFLSGCKLVSPDTPLLGITEPFLYDGVSIKVEKVEIRNSYSIYYTMNYPVDTDTFYAITTSIDGFDDPRSALTWGEENLKLISESNEGYLAFAQWIILGDNIQYKSGETFTYRYVFFFSIPKGSDYTQYRLKLPGEQWIETSEILDTYQIETTSTHEKAVIDSGILEDSPQLDTSGQYSTISGGSKNSASAYHTTISGGYLNLSSAAYASIGGGRENLASNLYTTIGGGYGNSASGRDTTIGGGSRNTASYYHATVGGGIRNQANASDSTISGGSYNLANQPFTSVGGGTQNIASGMGAVVGGGAGNSAVSDQSTVSGGLGNQAAGIYAVIGGGQSNIASGAYSAVPGGATNQAQGDFSLAAGRRSIVDPSHPGVTLFSDSIDADFKSSNSNEFGVRATGGVRFITSVDALGEPSTGVILPAGGGSWSSLSDQEMKENLVPANQRLILEALIGLQISEWNYISQNSAIRHIGPMAGDFFYAFGTGEDARYISSIDADGISLASIQGLYQIVTEKNHQIVTLETRISVIERQLKIINQLITITLITGFSGTTIFQFHTWKKYTSSNTNNLNSTRMNVTNPPETG